MSAATTAEPDDFAPLIDGGVARSCGSPENPEHDAETLLMLDVGNGSEQAFAKLVSLNQTALLNFFARIGASSDRDDLVQETFLRLFRYRRKYRATARFAAFLYHIARNVWADRGRKIVRIERLSAELQNEAGDAFAPSANPGQSKDIDEALNQLSPKLREVIVLNIYQGLRYQEVADVLEIPLGTVKSRINLAIAALKEIFNER